jgi:hypothetical protein
MDRRRAYGPTPAKLPFQVEHVIKASRVLSSGAKLVWLEHRALHRGEYGVWAGAGPFAQRLGMSRGNVELHRRDLVRLRLMESRYLGGQKTANWYPLIPAECIPCSARPTQEEIAALAARLDGFLERQDAIAGCADMAQSAAPNAAAQLLPHDASGPQATASNGIADYGPERREGGVLPPPSRDDEITPSSAPPPHDGVSSHALGEGEERGASWADQLDPRFSALIRKLSTQPPQHPTRAS